MKITDFSIKRPVTVLIITSAMAIFGIYSLSNMGMQRIPDVDFPMVTVTTTMDGASPSVMDNDVTDVIEEKLSAISGVKDMSSTSYEGRAVTMVQFDLGQDVDAAAASVRDKVNLAEADLPDEADTPIVEKYTAGDEALVTLAVLGDASYKDKVHFVDKVASPKFQSIDGVGNVSTPGMREREIRVWIDPQKLEARGLVVQDIEDAIDEKHVELPAGRIETDLQEYQLKLKGEYESLDELKTLPITTRDGAIVRLGDVSRIEDGFEDRRSMALYDGEETILVQISKQRGSNEVSVAKGIMKKVEELKKTLPKDIRLEVIGNQADFVVSSMKGVGGDIILAIVLCSVIMLFFLKTFRATFVTVITIPVCILGSFLILPRFGVTINNLSMMGISLAVGMVVDATTVVLENIHRHIEEGVPPEKASYSGTSEVAFSVLAGAATTMAVFAPIAFMGGIVGRLFYHFGITIVWTMLLSLILSLTLTPFLCSRILKKDDPGRIARSIDSALRKLEDSYSSALKFTIRHRRSTLLAAACLFLIGLIMASRIGMGFFPSEDRGDFTVKVELPSDISMTMTEARLGQIDESVRSDQAVAYTYVTVGTGTGEEIYKGDITVKLKDRSERGNIDEVMDRIRSTLSVFRDATITLATWGGTDISLKLVGDDTEKLVGIANKIIADLGGNRRVMDLKTDVMLNKPRYDIEINRDLTDDMNIDIKDLADDIYTYFGGTKAGVYKEKGYRYDIRLMAEKKLRKGPTDIENLTVRNAEGDLIRVPGLINIEKSYGPNMITRYGRMKSLEIGANCSEGTSIGDGVKIVSQAAAKYLPEDGSVKLISSGSAEHMVESMEKILVALITAIVLVYMIMAIQFESFLHPFTIMFSLPLLTPGAFGLLLLTGKDIDIMSMMGIILLVGIVVNNAILLVDFANQQREKGDDKVTAMLKAGPLRLRPILMTAISTLMGSIPIAMGLSEGAEMRQPMSIAVAGGLTTSTLMTLFVIPVIYLALDDAKDRTSKALRRIRLRKRIGKTARSIAVAMESSEARR